MVAAYRCGRQADALGAYQRCRAVLAEELGLEPGPELRRLEAAVLAQDASLNWYPAAAAGVVAPSDAMPGHAEAQRTGPQPTVAPTVPSLVGRSGELPTGTVTFLLTDIEDSTRLWETAPETMEAALQTHNRLLTEVIEAHDGAVVTSRGEGNSFFAVFASAVSAVEAAGACQLRLNREAWPAGAGLRVRIGLHTGEAHVQDGGYVDHTPINRCAAVKAAAHGGQVLVTKTTRDLAGWRLGGGFGLKRLGEFRLRDLAGPELIYQLTHADLPADFPPLVTVAERTGNLPAPVSSFIGRVTELERAAAALAQARLVTLTGAGGVGKTRLAVEVARQVRPRFADDAWLAELAPVRDAAGVDDAVAAVFSVRARAGQGTREALVEFLRAKELLLVLDNCEHLLGAAAALAEALARSCERLVILATSREGLRIEGERLVPVPPLGVPSGDADLETISDAEAVRLFAERAAAVKPGFQVMTQNAAAVATVVRRLDGIALAVELAAARVPAMTPVELARRLERSFAVLAGGWRGAAEHHQTLRATIDWSFELLTEPEQRLLVRLAVFAGGATLEAAEAVCGGEGIDSDEVFGLLASLVARSLVVAEERGPQTRYRLLETIRQYGQERLDQSGQTERWHAGHASYYADLLRQARDLDQEVFWAVQVSAEQDNLLAAWSWAIGTGNVDAAFSILAGFAPYEIWNTYPLLLRGSLALELPGAAGHPGFPLALAVTAVFSSVRGDVTGAEELCRRAAEANARRDPPDWRVEETIFGARGNIANTRGAFADAARLAEQAAGIARAGGDLADASLELAIAAADHVLVGDTLAAVPLANEAHSLARRIGAPALVATGLLAVGLAVAGTDSEQARACLRESRELSTGLAYNSLIGHILATGVAFLIGDRAATLELGRNAIRGLQWGGGLGMGIILHMIADALSETRPDPAAIIHGAADAYAVAPPNPAGPSSPAVLIALGQEHVQELRARGAEMDWNQVMAYTLAQVTQVLSELGPETATPEGMVPAARHTRAAAAAADDFELSEREMEVARLVADGLSNPAIASALFISVAMVETHVSHILARLGLDSRVQLASWVSGHDPGPPWPARR
jgi:predicted ATPase/class 3 adenylate cyclase/DNA-binding CsgD family transcriptional regulator